MPVGVLVRVTTTRGVVRRVADQVQGPEDPVAEEQRYDEQKG